MYMHTQGPRGTGWGGAAASEGTCTHVYCTHKGPGVGRGSCFINSHQWGQLWASRLNMFILLCLIRVCGWWWRRCDMLYMSTLLLVKNLINTSGARTPLAIWNQVHVYVIFNRWIYPHGTYCSSNIMWPSFIITVFKVCDHNLNWYYPEWCPSII